MNEELNKLRQAPLELTNEIIESLVEMENDLYAAQTKVLFFKKKLETASNAKDIVKAFEGLVIEKNALKVKMGKVDINTGHIGKSFDQLLQLLDGAKNGKSKTN